MDGLLRAASCTIDCSRLILQHFHHTILFANFFKTPTLFCVRAQLQQSIASNDA